VNPFDLVALLLLVFAVLAGIRTGALPQIGGISGAVVGLLLVFNAAPWLIDTTRGVEPIPRALIVLATIIGAVIVGELVGSAAGRAAADLLGPGVLSGVDRFAGGLVGAAQAILIIWLVGGLITAGPFPALAAEVEGSAAVQTADEYLPPPTEVIGGIASALVETGLPDVFVGLEPIPLEAVDTPTTSAAERIARAAFEGTARISTLACGTQIAGTAVVVADDYLVTNAHVVAGATVIRVALGNQLLDARAVLFDPQLDLAVLHAAGLDGKVLRFAASDPDRGTAGAAIGFAGGGPMVVLPAGVTGQYAATGRDIYGTSRVTRQILELRAQVEPGDSGGPLVLEDGTIGGLVFAESKSDVNVGYALTPTAVSSAMAQAIGRTGSVDLGRCIR
jgi:S1-C subfamily serine protease